MSRISRAQVLAEAAGLSVKAAARKAGMVEATFQKLASRGNANPHTAARLAHILGCDPQIFLWGAAHFSGAPDGRRNGHPKNLRSSPTTTGGSAALCSQRRHKAASRRQPALLLIEGEKR